MWERYGEHQKELQHRAQQLRLFIQSNISVGNIEDEPKVVDDTLAPEGRLRFAFISDTSGVRRTALKSFSSLKQLTLDESFANAVVLTSSRSTEVGERVLSNATTLFPCLS